MRKFQRKILALLLVLGVVPAVAAVAHASKASAATPTSCETGYIRDYQTNFESGLDPNYSFLTVGAYGVLILTDFNHADLFLERHRQLRRRSVLGEQHRLLHAKHLG
jgi:hypothetical protein